MHLSLRAPEKKKVQGRESAILKQAGRREEHGIRFPVFDRPNFCAFVVVYLFFLNLNEYQPQILLQIETVIV